MKGEGTFFELGGCYRRYHCPLSRTIYLGQPPPKFLARRREGGAGGDRGGPRCRQAGAPARRSRSPGATPSPATGFEKESRIGYSIGLSYPPDWGERTISLRAGETTRLEPGMCFHLIPAIWRDDWGLEISESFLVTEHGSEPFCTYPRRLLVKD